MVAMKKLKKKTKWTPKKMVVISYNHPFVCYKQKYFNGANVELLEK